MTSIKKESKKLINSLAKLASDKINVNNFSKKLIYYYESQIKLIKDLIVKLSALNKEDKNYKNEIIQEISNINNILDTSNIKKEIDKINQKYLSQKELIFDDNYSVTAELKDIKIDNFILSYQIEEKNFVIDKINSVLDENSMNNFFLSGKILRFVNDYTGSYYFEEKLDSASKILTMALNYFNIYNTQNIKLNSQKKALLNQINELKELIQILKKKTNNKCFKEDDNNLYDILINKISVEKKEPKKQINLLTISELFDVNNEEGENEAIIDDELHSDEGIKFEPKIKQSQKISKNENLTKIKKLIPDVDLSLIEFNKKKAMNEADLYSLENRKFNEQNIDDKIEDMKYKKKEILRKIEINKKKLEAMKKFVNNLQNNYNILKNLKLKSSVCNSFFCENNLINDIEIGKKDYLMNIQEEINEENNSEDFDFKFFQNKNNNIIDYRKDKKRRTFTKGILNKNKSCKTVCNKIYRKKKERAKSK